MGSGPQHYKLAEDVLDEAKRFMAETLHDDSVTDLADVFANHAAIVAQAQAHATLALVAATVANTRRNGLFHVDAEPWAEVLS
jgi:hypothetical protein